MDPDGPDGGTAYERLGELYDAWCAEVVEDVSFYVGLADALAAELGRASIDVVELGAGSGRITVPLAQAGHRVVAIDLSPSQLTRLRARVREAGAGSNVRAVEGDMLRLGDLVAPASCDLVLVPFRGMLHVTPQRDEVLAAVARVLRPGGAVAFDVFHPTAEQVGVTHGRWLHRREERTATGAWAFQERARYLPELAAEPGGLKLEVDVRCRWRRSRRRIRRRELHALADPAPEAVEQEALLELQLVPADRWERSLRTAGFTIDGAYGWFDARPLAPDDDDSIWVARGHGGGPTVPTTASATDARLDDPDEQVTDR
jgi:SAM-dependent methyltransferase